MSEADNLIIEEGLPPDVQASVDEFKKSLVDAPAPAEDPKPAEGTVEPAKPAEGGEAPAKPAEAPAADDVTDLDWEGMAKNAGVEVDTFKDSVKQDLVFEVETRKGKQNMSFEEATHYLSRNKSREESFQKRHNEILSKEGDFISMRKAAEGGDKKAIKAMVALANKYAKSDTLDALMDSVEGTEGDFDPENATKELKADFNKEDIFADVREDVDFTENMSKLEETFDSVIPPKIMEHYMSRDEDKKILYSVLKSPLRDEIVSGMETALASLTRESRLDVKSDPDKFALLFGEVVNGLPDEAPNNQTKPPAEKPQEGRQAQPNKDALDSISTGNRGRQSSDDELPDFAKMTPQEFAEYEQRLGI